MFKSSMQQFPYFLSRAVGNLLKKTCTEVLRFASSLQITLTKFVLSLGWYVLKIFHINFPKWYFILKCKLDHLLTFSLLWSFHYRTIFFSIKYCYLPGIIYIEKTCGFSVSSPGLLHWINYFGWQLETHWVMKSLTYRTKTTFRWIPDKY